MILTFHENLKWGVSSRWSFDLNSARVSIETTAIRRTRPSLFASFQSLCGIDRVQNLYSSEIRRKISK